MRAIVSQGLRRRCQVARFSVAQPEGLLVAAWPEIVSGPAGRALGLDASEYCIPLTAQSRAPSLGD
jgi:hypothetical protein